MDVEEYFIDEKKFPLLENDSSDDETAGGSSGSDNLSDYKMTKIEENFTFYEFGRNTIDGVTMDDILRRMSNRREALQNTSAAKTSLQNGKAALAVGETSSGAPGKKKAVKSFNIKEYQDKMYEEKNSSTIHRFKLKPLQWDGSYYPDQKLTKTLYRTPVSDPSGTKFFNLGIRYYSHAHNFIHFYLTLLRSLKLVIFRLFLSLSLFLLFNFI